MPPEPPHIPTTDTVARPRRVIVGIDIRVDENLFKDWLLGLTFRILEVGDAREEVGDGLVIGVIKVLECMVLHDLGLH